MNILSNVQRRPTTFAVLVAFCVGGAACASVLGLDDVSTQDSPADASPGTVDANSHRDGGSAGIPDSEATDDAAATDADGAASQIEDDSGDAGEVEEAGQAEGTDSSFICPEDAGQPFYFDFKNGIPEASCLYVDLSHAVRGNTGGSEGLVVSLSNSFPVLQLSLPADYFSIRPLRCTIEASFDVNDTSVVIAELEGRDSGSSRLPIYLTTSSTQVEFSLNEEMMIANSSGALGMHYFVGFAVSPTDAGIVNVELFARNADSDAALGVMGAVSSSMIPAPTEFQLGATSGEAPANAALSIFSVECGPLNRGAWFFTSGAPPYAVVARASMLRTFRFVQCCACVAVISAALPAIAATTTRSTRPLRMRRLDRSRRNNGQPRPRPQRAVPST